MMHLRHGCLNHLNVPVEFRIEMHDKLEGIVEGGLFGARLSLVEFVLKHGISASSASASSTLSKTKTIPNYDNDEAICISDCE